MAKIKRKKPRPTLAALKKRAWKLLSEVIRREAAQECSPWAKYITCYTCGANAFWKEMQAGHAIGGRTGAVLLDEEIIRPQCYRCNVALRGNYPVFVTKLIREKARYMPVPEEHKLTEAMAWWEVKLQASHQIRKWTCSELEIKIVELKDRLSKLS